MLISDFLHEYVHENILLKSKKVVTFLNHKKRIYENVLTLRNINVLLEKIL